MRSQIATKQLILETPFAQGLETLIDRSLL